MAVIRGNLVSKFTDRDIEVEVWLNYNKELEDINAGKVPPKLLENTDKLPFNGKPKAHIGKAVICQEGSHISIVVRTTTPPLAGIRTKVWTRKEIIWDAVWNVHENRYQGNMSTWVDHYYRSDDPNGLNKKSIVVNDLLDYDKEEGFARSNCEISVHEVDSYKRDNDSFPKAGIDGDVKQGALDAGKTLDISKGSIWDIKEGREMGTMEMQFFILKDQKAIDDFAEALQGTTADDDW